jgi:hypothetical protein
MTALRYCRCMAGTICFLCGLLLIAPSVFPDTGSTGSEYEQKAEFICNFAKFVRWPGDEGEARPLQICILGKDPFGPALRMVADRTVRGRAVSFRVCPDIRGTENCHIVFVSASEKERVTAILTAFRPRPVLTVGDRPGFAVNGGMINLVHTGEQLRFEINTDAALQSGLHISSQLLKLARIVTVPSEKDDSQ